MEEPHYRGIALGDFVALIAVLLLLGLRGTLVEQECFCSLLRHCFASFPSLHSLLKPELANIWRTMAVEGLDFPCTVFLDHGVCGLLWSLY